MAGEKYRLGNFEFNTEEEYLRAKKEMQFIRIMSQKKDIKNPKEAQEVLNYIREKNINFQTVVGKKYLLLLKQNAGFEKNAGTEKNAGIKQNAGLEQNAGIEKNARTEKNAGLEKNARLEKTESREDEKVRKEKNDKGVSEFGFNVERFFITGYVFPWGFWLCTSLATLYKCIYYIENDLASKQLAKTTAVLYSLIVFVIIYFITFLHFNKKNKATEIYMARKHFWARTILPKKIYRLVIAGLILLTIVLGIKSFSGSGLPDATYDEKIQIFREVSE